MSARETDSGCSARGVNRDAERQAIQISVRAGTLWIETKAQAGRQSPARRLFQQIVESEGHVYLVVQSAAQLYDWAARSSPAGLSRNACRTCRRCDYESRRRPNLRDK